MNELDKIRELNYRDLFIQLIKYASNWKEEHDSDYTFAEIADSYIEVFNNRTLGLKLYRSGYDIAVDPYTIESVSLKDTTNG